MSDRPHPWLRVEQTGPANDILTVTLDRPQERNPQVPSLWLALAEVGRRLPREVRVVVLRGAGSTFSAGLHRAMFQPGGMPPEPDLAALAALAPDEAQAQIAGFQEGFTIWRDSPAVVVAAVQGHAIGAGFQLALAADLRLVADDVRLAMRETSLGLVPDLGGTRLLTGLVGYARALEICATGRFVGADEAVHIGLATAAVPPNDLEAATDDLVVALLAAPEHALRALKPLLRDAHEHTPAEQLRAERSDQVRLLGSLAASRRT